MKENKNVLEKIKTHAKKNCYRDKTKFFENDKRNSWKSMKEIIGKRNITIKRYLNI